MGKILNHLYYSCYCWIHWSWTIFDVKKRNKNFNIFGEVEATNQTYMWLINSPNYTKELKKYNRLKADMNDALMNAL